MRTAFLAILFLAALLLSGAAMAQTPDISKLPPGIFASPADVQALIAKAKSEHKTDATTIEVLAALPPLSINLEYRTVVTAATQHVKEAELIYVIQGSGTFTLGGTLENSKVSRPDNLTGTALTGGTKIPLTPGTFIFVPENTPHWFSAITSPDLATVAFHVPRTAPK